MVCNCLKNSPYAIQEPLGASVQGLPLLVTLWASVHFHAATGTRRGRHMPKRGTWETSRRGEALPPLLATAMRQDRSCGPCRSEMCTVNKISRGQGWPLPCALWSPGLWIGRRPRHGSSSLPADQDVWWGGRLPAEAGAGLSLRRMPRGTEGREVSLSEALPAGP